MNIMFGINILAVIGKTFQFNKLDLTVFLWVGQTPVHWPVVRIRSRLNCQLTEQQHSGNGAPGEMLSAHIIQEGQCVRSQVSLTLGHRNVSAT